MAMAEMGLGEWQLDKPPVGEVSAEETKAGKNCYGRSREQCMNEWSSGSS